MTKTWINNYTLETKEQSKQCVECDLSVPKKVKRVPSTGNIMASIFGMQKEFR